MAVAGAPLLSPEERTALEDDYRYGPDRLVRHRSHIVLLATELETQIEVAQVVRCSPDVVRRTLALYRDGDAWRCVAASPKRCVRPSARSPGRKPWPTPW